MLSSKQRVNLETSIHAFIEYNEGESEVSLNSLTFGELLIQPDEKLFDALGNGINYHFPGDNSRRQSLIPSRGFPENPSEGVLDRYAHLVYSENKPHQANLHPMLCPVPDKLANEWVENGWSHRINKDAWGNPGDYVSAPIWHSPGWLSLGEVFESLKHFDLTCETLLTDRRQHFPIYLQTMNQIECQLGADSTRLVFWFEN